MEGRQRGAIRTSKGTADKWGQRVDSHLGPLPQGGREGAWRDGEGSDVGPECLHETPHLTHNTTPDTINPHPSIPNATPPTHRGIRWFGAGSPARC
jgi:hypothetical protein